MLELEQCFSFTVTRLLFQIGARTLPAMVPHKRTRCKRDPLARLLQAPTHVDIVTRLAKLGIKPADLLQGVSMERHVAAGNMFRELIAFQDVGWLPWASRDTGGEPTIVWRKIWSSHGRGIRAL